MAKATDVEKFLEDLNGGNLKDQLAFLLSDVASGVTTNSKVGEVVLKFKIKQIGDEGSTQISVKAELSHKTPTSRGVKSECISSETPMHVNSGGEVTMFPNHSKQLFEERS